MLYLGDDLDVALGGVGDDVGDILLAVEAAVGGFLPYLGGFLSAPGHIGAVDPPRAHVVELWVAVDLDAPPLVVGEVPMEAVEFVHGHEVEMLLDVLDGEEMAADIEMAAAPREAGIVGNGASWQHDAAIEDGCDVGGQHLEECLVPVEEACFGGGIDEDPFRHDAEAVAFGAEGGLEAVEQREGDAVLLGRRFRRMVG